MALLSLPGMARRSRCDRQTIGAYVPVEDLNKFYREDVCGVHDWKPRHWTGIARQLGHIARKKMIRQNGRRLIAYEIAAS